MATWRRDHLNSQRTCFQRLLHVVSAFIEIFWSCVNWVTIIVAVLKLWRIRNCFQLRNYISYMNWWRTWTKRKPRVVIIKIWCRVAAEVFHERIFQLLLIDMLGCAKNQRQFRCFRQIKRLDGCRKHNRFLSWVVKMILRMRKSSLEHFIGKKYYLIMHHSNSKAALILKACSNILKKQNEMRF